KTGSLNKILSVGCGCGELEQELIRAGNRVIAIDVVIFSKSARDSLRNALIMQFKYFRWVMSTFLQRFGAKIKTKSPNSKENAKTDHGGDTGSDKKNGVSSPVQIHDRPWQRWKENEILSILQSPQPFSSLQELRDALTGAFVELAAEFGVFIYHEDLYSRDLEYVRRKTLENIRRGIQRDEDTFFKDLVWGFYRYGRDVPPSWKRAYSLIGRIKGLPKFSDFVSRYETLLSCYKVAIKTILEKELSGKPLHLYRGTYESYQHARSFLPNRKVFSTHDRGVAVNRFTKNRYPFLIYAAVPFSAVQGCYKLYPPYIGYPLEQKEFFLNLSSFYQERGRIYLCPHEEIQALPEDSLDITSIRGFSFLQERTNSSSSPIKKEDFRKELGLFREERLKKVFLKRVAPDLEVIFSKISMNAPVVKDMLYRFAFQYKDSIEALGFYEWVSFRLYEDDTLRYLNKDEIKEKIKKITKENPDFLSHRFYDERFAINKESMISRTFTTFNIPSFLNSLNLTPQSKILIIAPGWNKGEVDYFTAKGVNKITSLDKDWRAVRMYRQDYRIKAVRGDLLKVNQSLKESFDVILGCSVLGYVLGRKKDAEAKLRALADTLYRIGLFKSTYIFTFSYDQHKRHRLSPQDISILEERGFSCLLSAAGRILIFKKYPPVGIKTSSPLENKKRIIIPICYSGPVLEDLIEKVERFKEAFLEKRAKGILGKEGELIAEVERFFDSEVEGEIYRLFNGYINDKSRWLKDDWARGVLDVFSLNNSEIGGIIGFVGSDRQSISRFRLYLINTLKTAVLLKAYVHEAERAVAGWDLGNKEISLRNSFWNMLRFPINGFVFDRIYFCCHERASRYLDYQSFWDVESGALRCDYLVNAGVLLEVLKAGGLKTEDLRPLKPLVYFYLGNSLFQAPFMKIAELSQKRWLNFPPENTEPSYDWFCLLRYLGGGRPYSFSHPYINIKTDDFSISQYLKLYQQEASYFKGAPDEGSLGKKIHQERCKYLWAAIVLAAALKFSGCLLSREEVLGLIEMLASYYSEDNFSQEIGNRRDFGIEVGVSLLAAHNHFKGGKGGFFKLPVDQSKAGREYARLLRFSFSRFYRLLEVDFIKEQGKKGMVSNTLNSQLLISDSQNSASPIYLKGQFYSNTLISNELKRNGPGLVFEEYGYVDARKFCRITDASIRGEAFKEIEQLISEHRRRYPHLKGACESGLVGKVRGILEKENINLREIINLLSSHPVRHLYLIAIIEGKEYIIDPTAEQFTGIKMGLLVIPKQIANKHRKALWMYSHDSDVAASPVEGEKQPLVLTSSMLHLKNRLVGFRNSKVPVFDCISHRDFAFWFEELEGANEICVIVVDSHQDNGLWRSGSEVAIGNWLGYLVETKKVKNPWWLYERFSGDDIAGWYYGGRMLRFGKLDQLPIFEKPVGISVSFDAFANGRRVFRLNADIQNEIEFVVSHLGQKVKNLFAVNFARSINDGLDIDFSPPVQSDFIAQCLANSLSSVFTLGEPIFVQWPWWDGFSPKEFVSSPVEEKNRTVPDSIDSLRQRAYDGVRYIPPKTRLSRNHAQ
ncbi:MAG: hypothetical protein WAW67_04495, partial [Candidatus Omnitrophota bacterium]